jgi:hypothetical protein
MAYSASADVIARSSLLASISDAATYIAIADADIDAALADIYTVPFTAPIPALITKMSADKAAAYKLRQLYRGGSEAAGAAYAELKKDFDADLEGLRNGSKSVDADRASSIPGGDSAFPSATNQTDSTGEPLESTFRYGTDVSTDVTPLDII